MARTRREETTACKTNMRGNRRAQVTADQAGVSLPICEIVLVHGLHRGMRGYNRGILTTFTWQVRPYHWVPPLLPPAYPNDGVGRGREDACDSIDSRLGEGSSSWSVSRPGASGMATLRCSIASCPEQRGGYPAVNGILWHSTAATPHSSAFVQ